MRQMLFSSGSLADCARHDRFRGYAKKLCDKLGQTLVRRPLFDEAIVHEPVECLDHGGIVHIRRLAAVVNELHSVIHYTMLVSQTHLCWEWG